MTSKQVVDRAKSAKLVVAAAETHADEVERGVAERLRPYLKHGERMPDVGLFLRLIARQLSATMTALEEADAVNEREMADDAAPRNARDVAAAHVSGVLVDLHAAISASWGDAGLHALGLDGETPSDPAMLASRAKNAIVTLESDAVKLPAPRRGTKVDRKAFAEDLREALPSLEQAMAQVAREVREGEATVARKQEAMSAHDTGFTEGAGVLSAVFRYGGKRALGAKLRPSGRHPGEVSQTDGAPEPTAPADDKKTAP